MVSTPLQPNLHVERIIDGVIGTHTWLLCCCLVLVVAGLAQGASTLCQSVRRPLPALGLRQASVEAHPPRSPWCPTPTDMQWRVLEKEEETNSGLQLCLDELDRCNVFLGIVGARYGQGINEYMVPEEPKYDWVHRCKPGKSLQELETRRAVLNSGTAHAARSVRTDAPTLVHCNPRRGTASRSLLTHR